MSCELGRIRPYWAAGGDWRIIKAVKQRVAGMPYKDMLSGKTSFEKVSFPQ